jgi:hypothetical protein
MAPRGKTVQLKNMYVADFETCDADQVYTIDKTSGMEIKNQKVWLAGFKNLETMRSTYSYNLDDFMEAIMSRGDNVNTEYAIHNLKFDGSFIIPYLFKAGYTVSIGKPGPKEFSILVDDRNAWYSITIQVTKRRRVLIWDSVKLFPSALEYLHEVYSTPTKKIHEDDTFYNTVRPDGYTPNERELMYFENDLQVPAETINKHIELFGLQFKKTQAGQAFHNFEKTFPMWKFRFPALTTEQHETIKEAYWGGIAYAAKDKAGQDHYNIGVKDINSSYPDKAANFKLPYGPCLEEFGEGQHPNMSKFWIAEALVTFELKPNCLPCIPYKAISEGQIMEDKDIDHDKWLDDSHGIVRMTFSCIDLGTMMESYDFKIKHWMWSMHWAWKIQKEIAKFVNTNNDIKVEFSKKANALKNQKDHCKELLAEYLTKRNRAKIDNNAFYGKFGEEIIKFGKTPHYEDDDIIWRTDREDETSEGKRKFLPVAIAITAWGRRQLVQAWNIVGEYCLYCDTDSLHYLKDGGDERFQAAINEGLVVEDAEQLGAWKHEGNFTRGRYLRAKCYMEEDEKGKREATVAGLPADKHSGLFSKKRSCLDWNNFHIGHKVPAEKSNKLRTIRTRTGNKLVPVGFEIKEKDLVGF